MAKKPQEIKELSQIALAGVMESKTAWKHYLNSLSYLYKYSFPDTLLIHAQSPDTTAVAPHDIWHGIFHRYINRGATGIALIDDFGERHKVKYVFAFEDTNGGRLPYIWNYRPEHEKMVLDALKDTFDIPYSFGLENAVVKTCVKAVKKGLDTKLGAVYDQNIAGSENSNLFAKCFENALIDSAAYTVFHRLRLDETVLMQAGYFDTVLDFNTPALVTALGTAVGEAASEVLQTVEKAVKKYERQKAFAVSKSEKRSEPHENSYDLQNAKRDKAPAISNESAEQPVFGQIRQDTQGVSESSTPGNIQRNAADGHTDAPSARNGRTGVGNDGAVGKTVAAEPSIPAEGQRLGADTAQADTASNGRRNRAGRTDTGQLTLFDTREQSEGAEKSAPFFAPEIVAQEPYVVIEFSESGNFNSEEHITAEEIANAGKMISILEPYRDTSFVPFADTKTPVIPITAEVPQVDLDPRPEYEPIANTGADDFIITDDNLGVGEAQEKCLWNIRAIKLLKQIEGENRSATKEEQETLSKYVGWGGLSEVFAENSTTVWRRSAHDFLKENLTSAEYSAAMDSTVTAFYTPPIVIDSIYKALEKFGFEGGNILEPSMGIGNFLGRLPESMKSSHIYGVELDSISGRIAKLLYPGANVKITGFEKTDHPDNFFDAAIGNIPFGDFGVADQRYDRYNFKIHDYFFSKALDKVRPGGIIAFVTSKGTLDKQTDSVRRYLAMRTDLIGAIRLPNTAFAAGAGTEVTSDIIILQKRLRMREDNPEWIYLGETPDGVPLNQYFLENPEMICGRMAMQSGPFGPESACLPYENKNLPELLDMAVSHLHGYISEYEGDGSDVVSDSIPANPEVKNYTYTVVCNDVYYRENSLMTKCDLQGIPYQRTLSLIELRRIMRDLITAQVENASDMTVTDLQTQLNEAYDSFEKKYGRISSRGNKLVFREDDDYPLLCSLEVYDDEGEFQRKADFFTERTIRPYVPILHTDTAPEALAVSLNERGRVDLSLIQQLTGFDMDQVMSDLNGLIYRVPKQGNPEWMTADEYLSGDVRHKLRVAAAFANEDEAFKVNMEALKAVQPEDLDATEISVRLGALWIPVEDYANFTHSLLKTSSAYQEFIQVMYAPHTGNWAITSKHYGDTNPLANNTYGTKRANAYRLIEDSLNQRDTRIFDTVKGENGEKKSVLNRTETIAAQEKQMVVNEAFKDWIFADQERRQRLVKAYNVEFNCIRPRTFDGSFLTFPGMAPEIKLLPHQLNAVARIIYGGNALLAHCVGAGKTFECIAAAIKMKQLGLCSKPVIVVPNHLIEQWGSEFLRLFPSANILLAHKTDFEKSRRQRFCSRIATGNYDAVIIGHSSFEKITISPERHEAQLRRQIYDIVQGIEESKKEKGQGWSVKQMTAQKKRLEARIERLEKEWRKDRVVYFEEIGCDVMFVDESQTYKNLFAYTKMRNVAGVAQTEAQRSQDMFMKTQYINEITPGRGVVFASGTPISNTMTELYTLQRYLQYELLNQKGLALFDNWAAAFGERVTSLELSPEGSGYRTRTRFAKFFNLPELISMYRSFADVQTADMLKLPVPEKIRETVELEPSQIQKDMVQAFSQRAEAIHNRRVKPQEDNMLKVTNDGRKLALDQRLYDVLFPDDEGSKVNAAVERILQKWEDTAENRSTQVLFCDMSTPNGKGFSVYRDVKEKLMAGGIPENEVAFIHDADTDAKKADLFAKVRSGTVRVILGSTQMLGAGTNMQNKLLALHHLDIGWRPSDLEQREGRIIRQGNENPHAYIYRYIKKGTFDAYMWQILEQKQRFIMQIQTSKSIARTCEDIDETVLDMATVKALAIGDPAIREKMELDLEVGRLNLLKSQHKSNRFRLEDDIKINYPQDILKYKQKIARLEQDVAVLNAHPQTAFSITINGRVYDNRTDAGEALMLRKGEVKASGELLKVGEFCGLDVSLFYSEFLRCRMVAVHKHTRQENSLSDSPHGNIQRIENLAKELPDELVEYRDKLSGAEQQLESMKDQLDKPFAHEAELTQKQARLIALNHQLSLDKPESPGAELMDAEPESVSGENEESEEMEAYA